MDAKLYPCIPFLGLIITCLYLGFLSLDYESFIPYILEPIYLQGYFDRLPTWMRVSVWMFLGVVVYLCYGMRHSQLAKPEQILYSKFEGE
jgi:hypothetical protein